MKTTEIRNHLQVALKRSALALAAIAGLAIGSAQALTTTQTFNLGTSPAKTTIQSGVSGLLSWIPKGSLPPGSILRSVSVNAKIESVDGGAEDDWASDLNVYFDPSPEAAGTAARLQVGGYGTIDTVSLALTDLGGNGWANGQGGPPATVNDTKSEAAWASIGAVDLNAVKVSVGNDYSEASWSGTITVEYDVSTLGVTLTSPANAQAYVTGTSVTVSANVLDPGSFNNTVTFHVTPISPSGSTVDTVSANTSSPFSADLGALPAGTYEIYATTANDDVPSGTATSATRTFTVAAATSTTTVLAAAGAPTTYGQNVTISATVSPTPTGGTVQFYDGVNYLGTPVPVNTGTGMAAYSTTTLSAGTHAVTAEYSGYQIYESSSTAASISQVVGKAQLTVRALNTLRAPNTANPSPFPHQISGYQNGQSLVTSDVTGVPSLSTIAGLASPAGNYPVTCALGTLASSNYSFTRENGTLTVAVVPNTFSVNFYAYPGQFTIDDEATVLVPEGVPAGMNGWFTNGWLNFEVPFGVDALPPATLTSNQGSSATFHFNNARNGWAYRSEPRTTLLGDGNGNMMDGHVNSTLDGEGNKFEMEMTGIPFATYDVIFYMGANEAQYGDGTGRIVFNGVERGFTVSDGAFDGTFTEMVDANTPGNYIVFTGVTGSSFTAQTWGLGPNDFNHVGPFGFQIREATVASGFTTWANANNAAGQAADQDHDNDGVDNGIEYFMGQTGSSFTAMPSLDGSNTVTWAMDPAYSGTYEVQTSPDLGIWTNVVPRPTPSGGSLSYLLPPGLGKQFVRLAVTPAP